MLANAVEAVLIAAAALPLIPTLIFAGEVLSGALPGERPIPLGKRARLAVLMPAHDEEPVIRSAIRSILPQLVAADRLLVVADNCSDATASIGAAAGAEVIVRSDRSRRGKGYALDFGVRHLRDDPPAVVIVIDADCQVGAGAIDCLARACDAAGRPVQALYTMHAGPRAGLRLRFAEFAWIVKNKVRPRGLRRLRLPCHLMGTGMAFSWAQLAAAALATGHLVEDLKYGLDFARAGAAPVFCLEARVSSVFPQSSAGVSSQRTRWEHGHLGMILNEAPRLLAQALRARNGELLALLLDLCVPPLALLGLLVGLNWVMDCVFWMAAGRAGPLWLSSAALGLLASAVAIAWRGDGRQILSAVDLLRAPLYPLSKLPVYFKFLVARQAQWVRSKRERD